MDYDFTGSVALSVMGSDGCILASLRWDPQLGARGGWSGQVKGRGGFASMRVDGFPIEAPAAANLSGVGVGPCDAVTLHFSTVEEWLRKASKGAYGLRHDGRIYAVPAMPAFPDGGIKAGDMALVGAPTDHVLTLTHEEAEARMGMRIPRASPVAVYDVATGKRVGGPAPVRALDLTPLANLATAVAWGVTLDNVISRWRAWHPAARVTWDLESVDEGRKDGRPTLRIGMTFWIDGWSSRWREWVSFGPASRLPVEETLGAILSGPKTQAEREAVARWRGGVSR